MKRRLLPFLAAAALVLVPTGVGGIASAAPASAAVRADVNDFTFESMRADYELGRDAGGHATLHVRETLVALFPDTDQNRGIVRYLPQRDETTRADYDVRIVGVTDGDGGRVPYETSTQEDADGRPFLAVALGDDSFVHGRTTYVIEYTERDVARHFADTDDDEFYWDVNGNDAAQPFGQVTANVTVDDDLRAAATGRFACYSGAYSSTAQCPITTTDDGWSATTTDLPANAGMTIAIGFRSGTFTAPDTPATSWLATVAPWLVLGAGALLVAATIVARVRIWKDAPGRGVIVPQYEGPADVGVLESAHFLGRGDSGLPATFVQFAVTGAATLREASDGDPTRRYSLVVGDPARLEVADDRRIFDELFPSGSSEPGSVLVLDRGSETLGDRLTRIDAGALAEVDSDGLIRRVRSRLSVLIRVLALGVVIAAGALLLWAIDVEVAPGQVWLGGLLGGGAALVLLFGAARAPRRLTREGALLREHLEGLRMYLRWAEEDRLRFLQSPTGAERTKIDADDPAAVVRLYERLLPWAIVWGLEEDWTRVLGEKYATTPPQSTGGVSFADGYLMSSFARGAAVNAFATTPPPSSSGSSGFSSGFGGSSSFGGSSGGGFSGGGGGGGGFGGR